MKENDTHHSRKDRPGNRPGPGPQHQADIRFQYMESHPAGPWENSKPRVPVEQSYVVPWQLFND